MSTARYAIRNENGDYWKRAGMGGWSDKLGEARMFGLEEARAKCAELVLWERRSTRRLTLVEVQVKADGA